MVVNYVDKLNQTVNVKEYGEFQVTFIVCILWKTIFGVTTRMLALGKNTSICSHLSYKYAVFNTVHLTIYPLVANFIFLCKTMYGLEI